MRFKTILVASTMIAAVSSAQAHAALFNFELTGSRNATFQIDTGSAPDFGSTSVFGDQFGYNNVSGIFDGVAGTAASVSFGSPPVFASLNINGTSLGFTQFASTLPLFTGTYLAPVFTPGTYSLVSIVSGSSTLTISAVAAAVPEPQTWAMLIVGFGAVGATMRRRKVRTAVRFA